MSAAPLLMVEQRTRNGARIDAHQFPPLPAKPLADALTRLMEDASIRKRADHACEDLGTNLKAYQEWRDGRRRTVTFDVADRILCHTDLLWWEVWGDDPTALLAFTGEVRDA